MKKLLAGFILILVSGVAYAALTITLAGPTDYTDPQWKSVCISNITPGGLYSATIEVCPSDEVQGIVGRCIPYTWSNGTLPAPAQTIVNYLITAWYTGSYNGDPNSQYAPP